MIFCSFIFLLVSCFLYMKNFGSKSVFTPMFFISSFLLSFYGTSHYITGEGVSYGVIFHLLSGVQNTGLGDFKKEIIVGGIYFALSFVSTFLLIITKRKERRSEFIKKSLSYLFIILSILVNPSISSILKYYSYNRIEVKENNKLEKETVSFSDLSDFELSKNSSSPHLIVIFAESLEDSFTNEQRGENLTPNIDFIKKRSDVFTGLKQLKDFEFTIAGMTSSLCGVPFYHPSGGNTLGPSQTFLPSAVCLGDVLSEFGYDLTYIQGSDLSFSGTRPLYQQHSFSNVIGKERILNEHPSIEQTNWGVPDDKLFDFSFNYFSEKAKKNKTALFLATIDTHFPSGHVSSKCRKALSLKFSPGIYNAVKCADFNIGNFIKKIRKSPNGENTVIVVLSDHLSIGRESIKIFGEKKDRKNLFLINKPTSVETILQEQIGSHLDVASTVLDAIGIEGNVGLGVSLYRNNEKSLMEFSKDRKISGYRKSVLKLWDYPSNLSDIKIDPMRSEVEIGKEKFKIPILLRFREGESISPFFSNGESSFLRYISNFQHKDSFLYVDRCANIQDVFNRLELNEEKCYAFGNLSGEIKVAEIKRGRFIDRRDVFLSLQLGTDFALADMRKRMLEVYGFLTNNQRWFFKNIPRGVDVVLESKVYLPRYKDELVKSKIENYFDVRVHNKIPYYKKFYGIRDSIYGKEILKYIYKFNYEKIDLRNHGKLSKAKTLVKIFLHHNRWLTGVVPERFHHHFNLVENIVGTMILSFSPSLEEFRGFKDQKIGLFEKRCATIKNDQIDPCRFIAHAGGRIDGIEYTNSLEAMNLSYKNGFRLFELDFIETADGVFVASHGWSDWKKQVGFKEERRPTLKEFKSLKILEKYTPMDIDDVNEWFRNHKDAILVTDKVDLPMNFYKKFLFSDRLIMELFSGRSIAESLILGASITMPTWDSIKGLGRSMSKTLRQLGIEKIAFTSGVISGHPKIVSDLKDFGIKSFVFNIKSLGGNKAESFFVKKRFDLIYGIYADEWEF